MFTVDELQLWGGMECTINRVHNQWIDQTQRSGHYNRTGDLQLFRELGLKTLRYGLLWERASHAGTLAVFDPAMQQMQQLGLNPIAGLVHHGSGPAHTDLLDPHFADKLASYALSVAQRYPWIHHWTPVNEPHTTARFSGLYGHWYPHGHDLHTYARCLVNELRATVLAMRAIRSVRRDALFISTEDCGKLWSTEPLAGIRDLREARRWLGLDLLCGRVGHSHPMLHFLRAHGIPEGEILWFSENPCPPDVIGLNYYVTSDRFLDHRTWLYPPGFVGGDTGSEPLVDIEAVRVRAAGIAGSQAILTEAWQRYGIPVAITEAHLGGAEEDQVRWLVGIWEGAQAAREAGVNCVAVTVWALLGSFDWSSLVTRTDGIYEPGVFTISGGGAPRPTALAEAVSALARGKPILAQGAGWWRQSERLTFASAD